MARKPVDTGPNRALGNRLRQARLSLNITQAEVAKDLFSVSYVSAVERGQIRPSLGALEQLARRLNVNVADLMREEEGVGADASPLAPSEQDDTDSLLREAQIHLRRGEPHTTVAILDSLIQRGLSLRDLAQAHAVLASAFDALREYDRAAAEAAESIAAADRVGDVESRERSRVTLGVITLHQQRPTAAMGHLAAVLENIDAGVVQDPLTRLRVLVQLGVTSHALGDDVKALEYSQAAHTLAGELENPVGLSELYAKLVAHARGQGDSKLARSFAARSLAALDEADRWRLMAQAYAQLGRSLARSAMPDEAEAALLEAAERAQAAADLTILGDVQLGLSAIQLGKGQHGKASSFASQALETATRRDDPVAQSQAHAALARVLGAKKDYAGAQEHFEAAIELGRVGKAPATLSDLYADYSSLLERSGDSHRALEMLREAWRLRAGGVA